MRFILDPRAMPLLVDSCISCIERRVGALDAPQGNQRVPIVPSMSRSPTPLAVLDVPGRRSTALRAVLLATMGDADASAEGCGDDTGESAFLGMWLWDLRRDDLDADRTTDPFFSAAPCAVQRVVMVLVQVPASDDAARAAAACASCGAHCLIAASTAAAAEAVVAFCSSLLSRVTGEAASAASPTRSVLCDSNAAFERAMVWLQHTAESDFAAWPFDSRTTTALLKAALGGVVSDETREGSLLPIELTALCQLATAVRTVDEWIAVVMKHWPSGGGGLPTRSEHNANLLRFRRLMFGDVPLSD